MEQWDPAASELTECVEDGLGTFFTCAMPDDVLLTHPYSHLLINGLHKNDQSWQGAMRMRSATASAKAARTAQGIQWRSNPCRRHISCNINSLQFTVGRHLPIALGSTILSLSKDMFLMNHASVICASAQPLELL